MAKVDEKTITTRSSRATISDTRRRAIEKTLPDAADKADFWNKLEQIKRTKTPPGKLAVQCEEMARQLDEFAPAVPGGHLVFIEQIKRNSDVLRKLAATYRQISKAGGSHFLRQCSIL